MRGCAGRGEPAGPLRVAPELTDGWWATLDGSLTALAEHATTRVATPDTVAITQEHLTGALTTAFPELSVADATVEEWCTAHADLNWANLTAPHCWLLDWEDWGRAPRGLDADELWRTAPGTGTGRSRPLVGGPAR